MADLKGAQTFLLPAELAAIRNAVADALIAAGHGNRDFIADLRAGGQDDGPFMRGAAAGFALGVVMAVSDAAKWEQK